ncbi:unnamed protein product [Ectocarpus sp. 4 AP-2014]
MCRGLRTATDGRLILPPPTPTGASGAAGAKEDEGDGAAALPPTLLPPVLRLLSADVLTEACTLLDPRSLATAAAACRSFRDVCQGAFPWRGLCCREWELSEAAEEQEGVALAPSVPVPRSRPHFRDSILGCDFRKLFPLIEQMPSGFDCSLLRDGSPANGANNADGVDAQEPDHDNHQQEADNHDGAAAAAAEEEGAGDGDGDAAINQGAAAPVAAGGGVAPRAPEEAEEKAGEFVIRGVRRRPAKRPLSPGVAAAAAAPAWASTATEEGQRPRSLSSSSSSGDVALQVEFRGGLGVGNRCVRADLPLPSTVLRERTGAGARSSLARHLETSPLALFRWLLAKMAATASGGAGAGGGSGAGRASPASPASAVHPGLVGDHHFQHDAQQQQAGGGAFAAPGAMLQAGLGQDAAATTGERRRRASSLPSGGPDAAGAPGGGQHGEKPKLPRVLCFPVALERGVVDVTPRLASYFEVTIIAPRLDAPHPIPDCIAVGVSESRFPLKGKMPGWDSRSYGYHSDDGGAFHDAGSMLFKCGPSFGAGDVVGCGLDYSVGGDAADLFFTLNGELLNGGSAAFRGVRGTFYPTVGVDSACPVRINLGGEPFRFDLAAALREGGQEATARESVAQHERGRTAAAAASAPAAGEGAPSTPAGAKAAAGASSSSSSSPWRSRHRSLPLPLPDVLPPPNEGSSISGANPHVALSH